MAQKVIITKGEYEKEVRETKAAYLLYPKHKNKAIEHPKKGTCGRCNEQGDLVIFWGEIICWSCKSEILK